MESVAFTVNGREVSITANKNEPLLWILRDQLALYGTKFGCGVGLCGSCTVILNGEAVRSCVIPATAAAGGAITTIEGLGADNLHSVLEAWIQEDVPQCGYCQPGFILAVAALVAKTPNPTTEEIESRITNISRCGTYPRIVKAIEKISEKPA